MILVDPQPRTLAMICDAPTRARLDALGPLVIHEDGRMPDAMIDEHLPEVTAILGQTAMPAARLARAEKLRAIVNVEGNFLPNVDYGAALDRGIHVLNASPAFALPVAEMALGMALDLARGISAADRAMRAGREVYGLESNDAAVPAQRAAGRDHRIRRPRPRAAPAARTVRLRRERLRPVAAGPRDRAGRRAARRARRRCSPARA